jgi:hypothetical protein
LPWRARLDDRGGWLLSQRGPAQEEQGCRKMGLSWIQEHKPFNALLCTSVELLSTEIHPLKTIFTRIQGVRDGPYHNIRCLGQINQYGYL